MGMMEEDVNRREYTVYRYSGVVKGSTRSCVCGCRRSGRQEVTRVRRKEGRMRLSGGNAGDDSGKNGDASNRVEPYYGVAFLTLHDNNCTLVHASSHLS